MQGLYSTKLSWTTQTFSTSTTTTTTTTTTTNANEDGGVDDSHDHGKEKASDHEFSELSADLDAQKSYIDRRYNPVGCQHTPVFDEGLFLPVAPKTGGAFPGYIA